MKSMKKITVILLTLLLAMGLLAGCGSNDDTTADQPDNGDGTVTLSGSISTNGSTSMEKVIGALSEAFMADNPGVSITYDPTGSGAGITAASEGTTDIGLSSRNLKDSEEGLTGTVIALDGIAIIVNNSNPVADLTLEQIAALAGGEIENWSEVGGNDAPVVVIGREAGSGTRDGFESIIGVEDCVYVQELTSTGAVIAAVAANEYSIGYASLASVNSQVKAVTVDGVEASEDTVLSGSYAVQRPFVFVTKEDADLSAAAQAFIDFVLSSDATEIISDAGAVQAR